MKLKRIGMGLAFLLAYLSIVAIGVGILAIWTDWAMKIKSDFWSVSLSPIGAIVWVIIAAIFVAGYEIGGPGKGSDTK